MKFYLKHILLWQNGKETRKLDFLNNKVNIITGDPSKGKSTIIEIIDYCFFSSDFPIVEGDDYISKIDWFGINFVINDKDILIARRRQNKSDYYYSADGDIPITPTSNFKESNLKNIIYNEFELSEKVVFPFGGDEIKKGTRISPRYFLLFNTQRRSVLSSEEVLFDKQFGHKNKRYQEALTRIIDLALGVTTVENLILLEELAEKENRVVYLERKIDNFNKIQDKYDNSMTNLIKDAKNLDVVNIHSSAKESIEEIKKKIDDNNSNDLIDNSQERDNLEYKKFQLQLKLKKYRKYFEEHKTIKANLKETSDSLKPIDYFLNNFTEELQVSKTDEIFNFLSNELMNIKKALTTRKSQALKDIENKIKEFDNEIKSIDEQLETIPGEDQKFIKKSNKQLMFLGEAKKTFEMINLSSDENIENIKKEIQDLETAINKIRPQIQSIDRADTLDTLTEYMSEIFDDVDFQLSGYNGYKPIFDVKTKMIQLKKVDKKINLPSDITVKNIGSSSNHLFLHLAFFSAIHKVFKLNNVPYIPPFLILDQPDSPYYEVENKDSKERIIFFKALKTLDNHIDYFNSKLKNDFQIIVLEHVSWKEIEKEGFKNFHLVDKEWRGDYGLI